MAKTKKPPQRKTTVKNGNKTSEEAEAEATPESPREYPKFDSLGPNIPDFETWWEEKSPRVREVQKLLNEGLADGLAEMDMQIRDLEKHQGAMVSILGFADSYLDVAEHLRLRELPARDGSWTNFHIERTLNAACARERRFRDIVKGLLEKMAARVSYGQSRLRAFVQADGQKV